MDPNATLARIRLLLGEIEEIEPCSLAEAIQDLDEWVSKGGFLPQAWSCPSVSRELATITYRYGDKEVTAYVPPF